MRSHPEEDATAFYLSPLDWGHICTPICLNLRLTMRSFDLAERSLIGLLLGPAGLVTLSGHFSPRPPFTPCLVLSVSFYTHKRRLASQILSRTLVACDIRRRGQPAACRQLRASMIACHSTIAPSAIGSSDLNSSFRSARASHRLLRRLLQECLRT